VARLARSPHAGTMSDLLLARAEAMGGVITVKDLDAAGLRSRDAATLVNRGLLTRIGPRAYVLTESLKAATKPEEHHRLVAMAHVHAFEGRVVASHHSAIAMHGVPTWGVDHDLIHVARSTGKSSRRRGELVIHEAYPKSAKDFDAVVTSPASGLAAVSVALAVIGTAMVDGEVAGIVAADHALHRGLMSVEEYEAWLERLARRPDISVARRVLERAEPLTESVGETRTRLLMQSMPELPEITPQFEFKDESGNVFATSDFLVGDFLVVESDGRLKYRAADGANQAEVEQIVWREKQREDRIRRHGHGHAVARVIWDDLDRPARGRAIIREGLRQAEALARAAAA